MRYASEDISKYRKNFNSFANGEIDERGPVAGEEMSVKTRTKLETLLNNLPSLTISENWGTPEERDRMQLQSIIGKYCHGSTPELKIENFINSINRNVARNTSKSDISEVFRTLLSIQTVTRIIKGFSYSGAGFIWEALLAAITGGKQLKIAEGQDDLTVNLLSEAKESNVSIVDFEAGGRAYSAKLLSYTGGGKYLIVKGSKHGLERSLKDPSYNGVVTYIMIGRADDDTTLNFYKYDVDMETFDRLFRNSGGTNNAQFVLRWGSKGFGAGEAPFATLSLDTERTLQYVRSNLNSIKNKLSPIYDNLGKFTSHLTEFFVEENNKKRDFIGSEAMEDAKNLQISTKQVVKTTNSL